MNTPFETFSISNPTAGTAALIGEIGAAIIELYVPDKNGVLQDVVTGYADKELYLHNPHHFGVVAGRYANRIANGRFELDGKLILLDRNNEFGDCIHGGNSPVHLQRFTIFDRSSNSVTLQLLMPDGASGFPGNLSLQITYTLSDDGAFILEYRATTDAPTVLNLTNHTYFNLDGTAGDTVFDHFVTINSDKIVKTDGKRNIPNGEFQNISGTVCDLRHPRRLGDLLSPLSPELQEYSGFDFNYAVRDDFSEIASVYAPSTGISLSIASNEPSLGFYTGNHLDGRYTGKGGRKYQQFSGVCFESQHFPNSPNCPGFPSTVLRPGEEYFQKTLWRFSV